MGFSTFLSRFLLLPDPAGGFPLGLEALPLLIFAEIFAVLLLLPDASGRDLVEEMFPEESYINPHANEEVLLTNAPCARVAALWGGCEPRVEPRL